MTVAQPWLELLQFIKSIWPRSNYVTSTWKEVPNEFFSNRCTCCLIFHNRSPSVTEDIEIWKSCMNALSSCHLCRCFQSNGVLYESYDNFMPGNFISGFKSEIQYPLAKMPWKYVSHHGWPTKKILVSWIVIRT